MPTTIKKNKSSRNQKGGLVTNTKTKPSRMITITNDEKQIKEKKNQTNIARFLSQTGRVINKNKNKQLQNKQSLNRSDWEEKFLKRLDEYLSNNNRELDKYIQLKRAKQRMNKDLNTTRATLEQAEISSRNSKTNKYDPATGRLITRGWNTQNRNTKFDPLFNMSKKQLEKIQFIPNAYIKNPYNDIFTP